MGQQVNFLFNECSAFVSFNLKKLQLLLNIAKHCIS